MEKRQIWGIRNVISANLWEKKRKEKEGGGLRSNGTFIQYKSREVVISFLTLTQTFKNLNLQTSKSPNT